MRKTSTTTKRVIQGSPEIFIDLDGVLADFSRGMTKVLREVHGTDETHIDGEYDNCTKYRSRMWDTVGTYQKNGGEMWYELEMMEGASLLWAYIKPYNPQILSATGHPRFRSEGQKHRWVAEKLGEDVVVNLTEKAQQKSRHASSNRILIDDKMKAIQPWCDNGGIGIHHTSVESTIIQLMAMGF